MPKKYYKYTKKEILMLAHTIDSTVFQYKKDYINTREAKEDPWFWLYDSYYDQKELTMPLEDMPLYINHKDLYTRKIVEWRLKIGK